MKPEDLLLADVLDFRPDQGTIRLQEQRVVILSATASDFSRAVLERCASALGVLPVPQCGWSDLGTPVRLGRFLGLRRLDRAAPVAALA